MKLGHARRVKNVKNAPGPIGREAAEYVDVWVTSPTTGNPYPLRMTNREFDKVRDRGTLQRDEIQPLDPPPSFFQRLFGGKNA